MLKNFGGNMIDISLIVGLNCNEFTHYNEDKITKYNIDVFCSHGINIISLTYNTKESRDACADSIMKEVNAYREENKKQDYIQGFKDGCEYTLKLKDKQC